MTLTQDTFAQLELLEFVTQQPKTVEVATALERHAELMLAQGRSDWTLLQVRGMARERAGRLIEALEDYRLALDLSPADAGLMNRIGLCLHGLGHFDEAAFMFDRALIAAPDQAETYYNRGRSHWVAGNPLLCWQDFERTVALNPSHHRAIGRLAVMAGNRGDWSAARSLAETALAIEPKSPLGLQTIIEANIAHSRWREAEADARTWLADPSLDATSRYRALVLLGDVLDTLGRYGEAFAAYVEGNNTVRVSLQEKFAPRGEPIIFQKLDLLHKALDRIEPESWRNNSISQSAISEARHHIFLLGFMRSGTTLLEQSLAAHPEVVTMEEIEAFGDSARDFLSQSDGTARLQELSSAELDCYRADYWESVRRHGIDPKGLVFVDKQPMNALKLPLIAKLFPEAKIIFAVRDPRDVVLSCFRRRFGIDETTYAMLNLKSTAKLYATYMELFDRYNDLICFDIRFHKHEHFVGHLDEEIAATCRFIGIDPDSKMHNPASRARKGETQSISSKQISEGLNDSGVGHWRHYRAELDPVSRLLQPWVDRFGYARD
jgi:tetratricopeptide (TPR) repeat protein